MLNSGFCEEKVLHLLLNCVRAGMNFVFGGEPGAGRTETACLLYTSTLELYEHRHKLPNQLSGGQQERVSIGRAIVKNPDILLCDEPTGTI